MKPFNQNKTGLDWMPTGSGLLIMLKQNSFFHIRDSPPWRLFYEEELCTLIYASEQTLKDRRVSLSE